MNHQGLLLDTHVWIWFRAGIEKFSLSEFDEIKKYHFHNKLFISSISVWEVAMLEQLGKIALHYPLHQWIALALRGINSLPLTNEVALESVLLPKFIHKDPADRMILATARVNGLKLMTKDEKILSYIKNGFLF